MLSLNEPADNSESEKPDLSEMGPAISGEPAPWDKAAALADVIPIRSDILQPTTLTAEQQEVPDDSNAPAGAQSWRAYDDLQQWAADKPAEDAAKKFNEDVARSLYDTRVRKAAQQQDRRETLQGLGETGWAFSDLRKVHEERGGARQQPTVGTWSKKASFTDFGMREEDGRGIFYTGKVNLIFGPSESGKSLFAFAVVAQEVQKGNHVIIIDFEDGPEGLVSRLTDMGLDVEEFVPGGSKPGGVYYIPARLGMEDDDFTRVRDAVEHHGDTASFVLIDAVTEAMAADGLNPDKAVEVASWAASMPKRFAGLGPAVGIIDHTNLSDTDRAGGSQHKKSMVDGVSYKVKRTQTFIPGRGGAASIYVAKDRVGSIREFTKPGESDGAQEYRGTFVMGGKDDREPFKMIGLTQADIESVPETAEDAEPTADQQMNALVAEAVRIVNANPGIGMDATKLRFEVGRNGERWGAIKEAVRLGLIRENKEGQKIALYPVGPPEGVQEELS